MKTDLKPRNRGLFKAASWAALGLSAALCMQPRSASAESALHALGEAQNKEYRDVKNLPPGATAEQVRAIRHKAYEKAMPLISNQIRAKEADAAIAGLKLGREIRADAQKDFAAMKGAKISSKKDAGKKGVNIEGNTPQAVTAPPASGRNANTTTGKVTGPGSAREVSFGGGGTTTPPANAPAAPTGNGPVVDGIIQHR